MMPETLLGHKFNTGNHNAIFFTRCIGVFEAIIEQQSIIDELYVCKSSGRNIE